MSDSPVTFSELPSSVVKRVLISDMLGKIGWSLRHHGCEHWYFYNHKNKCTSMFLLFPETDARICFEPEYRKSRRGMPSFTFYLKDSKMELLDNDCVSFSGKNDNSIFILCPNYDMPRPQNETRLAAKPKRKMKENGD